MVTYILSLKADLENVASLQFVEGADLCLSVRNPMDHTQVRERIVVDSSALEEGPNSHTNSSTDYLNHEKHPKQHHKKHHKKHEYAEAPCHFALKWSSDDSQRATIRVVTASDKVQDKVTASDEFVPLLALECDGLEPFDFHALGQEFLVTNTAGQEFRPDLSQDWKEYDLGSGSTSVSNLQVKFT